MFFDVAAHVVVILARVAMVRTSLRTASLRTSVSTLSPNTFLWWYVECLES